jgi:hypothetical protein
MVFDGTEAATPTSWKQDNTVGGTGVGNFDIV